MKSEFLNINSITVPDEFYNRITSGVAEIDEMFGGGILPGCAVTLTANPGTGKTTFVLQLLNLLSKRGNKVALATGEESLQQIAFNCQRLKVSDIAVSNSNSLTDLIAATGQYDVLAIDSFQTLENDASLNKRQFEDLAIKSLLEAAKENKCAVFFIMHITKGGLARGANTIPHLVDLNMRIDLDKESGDPTMRVFSFTKNRFGPCLETRALMTGTGLNFTDVPEPSENEPDNKFVMQSMNVLSMNGTITKQRVIAELNMTPSQAYILLKGMCDSGSLSKVGRGDTSYYELT